MGILTKGVMGFLLIGLFGACQLGYFNEKKEYVPKHPRFKLKDKPNMVFPVLLDTSNIYKLEKSYFMGKEEPSPGIIYMKFYPNGRCCSFMLGKYDGLQSEDLNTDSGRKDKQYYYSKDGKKIQAESFVYGQGYGMYVILDYFLNETGDTLIQRYDKSTDIYVKVIIPTSWEKYPVNW